MGEKKIKFTKDWLNDNSKVSSRARKVHKFEQMKVTRSEDLPELMTTQQAADLLLRHKKTIEMYRNEGALKFLRVRGRYYTTPEYIADFIETENRKR